MQNSFVDQFSGHIKLFYNSFDRIIVRGYIKGLFDVRNILVLLHNLGFSKQTNGVIKLMAEQLSAHITKTASQKNIPILWRDNIGGNGVSMQDYVESHYYSKDKLGVLCIIKSMETVQTVWNKELRSKSGDVFTKMYWCKKPVSQYYIYINDQLLGLCCLKISGYLPYYSQFYCNGHHYIKRQMDKMGLSYKMEDNSFVEVGDVKLLEELSQNLTGKLIESRIKYWWDIWFSFDKGTRSRRSLLLEHQWYTCQAEISTNVVFKSGVYFERVYDKLLEKHHRIGVPDRLSKIFDLKQTRKESRSSQRVYHTQACVKHWIGSNSIKMYNKGGNLLRVETTINNPGLPGAQLHKPVYNLMGYYWYGHGCNNRFLEALSEVDVSQLQGQPQQYTQSITTVKGKRVAAPDLRQEKQVALLSVLLSCRFSAEWFRVKQLKPLLRGKYSKTAEIRYQMEKLLQRGLLEKRQGSNYYRVTKSGYIWMYASYCGARYFVSPLLSKGVKNEIRQKSVALDEFEKKVNVIHGSLSAIFEQLNMVA